MAGSFTDIAHDLIMVDLHLTYISVCCIELKLAIRWPRQANSRIASGNWFLLARNLLVVMIIIPGHSWPLLTHFYYRK